MYNLRGSTNLTNITYDDFNYTEVNYTNYTDHLNHTDTNNVSVGSFLVWILSWFYL